MSQKPVICIFGAGANIAAGVAREFASNGYRVALVSRTAKPSVEGQFHVKADLSDSSSVAQAFAQVRKELGIPSVVVYNAAAHTPNDKKDPASLSLSSLRKDFAVNTFSVLAAADEAVKGFRQLSSDPGASKTFIYTGNCLNVEPIPGLLGGGMGKTASAHFIATAASAYKEEGISFHYADERTAEGKPVYMAIDADAHGSFYWQLAVKEAAVPWHATFVKGVGYKEFARL